MSGAAVHPGTESADRVETVDRPAAEFPPLTPAESGPPGKLTESMALAALVAIWAAKVYTTWGAWGNLTIDSGHEMYVPWMMTRGKVLYRDMWYMYGPGAPYLNYFWFRMFGARLEVLYWAGSLSALGSAIFLYLSGRRLSAWLLGWAAGAVVVLEAFEPSLFCFPLPYSFAAVYGSLVGCAFLWLVLSAARSEHWGWEFAAATVAALAMEVKPEFGAACYGTLALLMAGRSVQRRSWKPLVRGVALSLPGVAVCALTVAWMISIRGVEFITHQNLENWPTSYFMTAYSKLWLERNGFTLAPGAFYDAALRTAPLIGVAAAAYALLWWRRTDRRAQWLRALLCMAVALDFVARGYLPLNWREFREVVLTPIAFPRDMVLYVAAGAAAVWWRFWRRPEARDHLAIPLVLSFAPLLAFRVLMKMYAVEYPIFYNGPVVLGFLLLLSWMIPRRGWPKRRILAGQTAICACCLAVVFFAARYSESVTRAYVPLVTARGTVRTMPDLASNYAAAIEFMQEKAALGESVISIPEDTSLYFLSGTPCPLRFYLFTPGVVEPGRVEQEVIRNIEAQHIRYLLWSNRVFPEFGTPIFGEDFNREIGAYLRSHYHPVRRLLPVRPGMWEWTAVIWERNSATEGN